MSTLGQVGLCALALYLTAALATVAHELGHALGALLARRRPILIVLGVGPITVRLRRRAPIVVLRPLFPLGGGAFSDGAALIPSRASLALELMSGPALNTLLGAALGLIALSTQGGVALCLGIAALWQVAFALGQLLPLRLGGGALETDGAQLLSLLHGRPPTLLAAPLAARARELRQLGAASLAQRDLASAAILAVDQGDLDLAQRMVDEAGQPLDDLRQALIAVAACRIAAARGAPAQAAAALEEAFRCARDVGGAATLLEETRAAVAAAQAAESSL